MAVASVMAWAAVLPGWAALSGEAAWAELNRQVETRRSELAALIGTAKAQGITTDYAAVSAEIMAVFQLAAQQDRQGVNEVRRIFNDFRFSARTDPDAADKLPDDELRACLEVADHALAELRQQLAGTMVLSAPPDFSRGEMKLTPGCYRLDRRPVFPSSLVWLPPEAGLMQALGRLCEGFYQLTNRREGGAVDPGTLRRVVAATERANQLNAAPIVYFLGHTPADWMKEKHPEIITGARRFTQYDIDSPLVRKWLGELCTEVIPSLIRAAGRQPVAHLLANEPSFATMQGGWLAKNGVSALTLQKYRHWVAEKYQTVAAVNQAHGASYATLDQVNVTLPIDPRLRGGAVWYDWCRFNMDRVNDWFTFLKQQVQANDPRRSPVTIKKLGHTLVSPDRDFGMDMEYLTKLEELPGADLRVVPRGATYFGRNEDGRDTETGWGSRYAYLWVDQSMTLDFTKSLCPDKVFYDSEWHGFSTVAWRDFHLDRDYVRSALWLAFSHGMGAIKPWLWGRGADGALSPKADHLGELSTQPVAVDAFGRTMKELNAQADRVLAAVPEQRTVLLYYCEEAAIQSGNYVTQLKEVYEALKLLNVAVGFTTPTEIGHLSPGKQTVMVTPTPFVADGSLNGLRAFQHSGGRIVMVGAENSFGKNELGVSRGGDAGIKAFGSTPMTTVLDLVEKLDATLAPLQPVPPVEVAVTDQAGNKAIGVMISQIKDPKTGKPVLLLNNVSKDSRVAALTPREGVDEGFVDLISHRPIQSPLLLEPCAVRLLMHAGYWEQREGIVERLAPGGTFSVKLKADEDLVYHVYVPKNYRPDAAPPPMLIAFSPKGDGRQMIAKMKDGVEASGWLLVGCDSLRNGMKDHALEDRMEDAFLNEILGDLPHDGQRVYLAGFSGGAMRAYGITARRAEKFAGIIAYGGWLGGQEYQEVPYPAGMAVVMINGVNDQGANKWKDIDTATLVRCHCRVTHLTHPGGHQVAPAASTAEAIGWLQNDWVNQK